MGCRRVFARHGIIFCYSGSSSGELDCDWRSIFLKNGEGFSLPQSRLVLIAKQFVPTAANNAVVGFFSVKGRIKTWQQDLDYLQS